MVSFSLVREIIKREYKKEFILWALSIFIFSLSLLFLVRELQKFSILSESKKNIEDSYFRLQPQIVKIKEKLGLINWHREFKKDRSDITLMLDMRDIKGALKELRALSKGDMDTYLIIKEMSYKWEKDKPEESYLKIVGELWTYR